jgi:hypothetical protein
MTTELSTKRAALELIKAEKQRRIDLKMASGEAIWGPPLILVSRVPDKETLPDGGTRWWWWNVMPLGAKSIARSSAL